MLNEVLRNGDSMRKNHKNRTYEATYEAHLWTNWDSKRFFREVNFSITFSPGRFFIHSSDTGWISKLFGNLRCLSVHLSTWNVRKCSNYDTKTFIGRILFCYQVNFSAVQPPVRCKVPVPPPLSAHWGYQGA